MPKLQRLLLHFPNQHSLVLLLNKLILPYDSLQNSIFKSHFAEQKYISKNPIVFNRKAGFHILNAVFLEVKLFSTEMKIIFQSKFALSPACHRTVAKEMPRKKVQIVKSNISDSGNLWVNWSPLHSWSCHIPRAKGPCLEWFSFTDKTQNVWGFGFL